MARAGRPLGEEIPGRMRGGRKQDCNHGKQGHFGRTSGWQGIAVARGPSSSMKTARLFARPDRSRQGLSVKIAAGDFRQ
jgi:hypothetical protein